MRNLSNYSLVGSLTLEGRTQGSIPFIGPSGVVSIDATNFTWDNTNKIFSVPKLKAGVVSQTTGQIILCNAGSAQTVALQAGVAASANNRTYTFPTDYPSATSALCSSASGVMSWIGTFGGDTGTGGSLGLVPAPSSGSALKFLMGNGTWAYGSSLNLDGNSIRMNPNAKVYWATTDGNGVFNYDYSTGAYAVNQPDAFGGNTASRYQIYAGQIPNQTVSGLTSGHTYKISFWAKIVAGNESQLVLNGSVVYNYSSLLITGSWVYITYNFVAAASTATLSLVFQWATPTTDIYICNVAVQESGVNYAGISCPSSGILQITDGGSGTGSLQATAASFGTPSVTLGWIDFHNASNAYRTIIQGSVISGTADITYTLPTAPPSSNGYVLSATTAGVMSWIAQSSGGTPAGNNIEIQYNNSGSFGSSPAFTYNTGGLTIGKSSPGGTTGTISLLNSNHINYVTLKCSDSASAGYTFVFPVNLGTNGYVLATDGGGVTSWVAQSTTPAGSTTQIQYNNGGVLAGNAALTWTQGSGLYLGTASVAGGLRIFAGTGQNLGVSFFATATTEFSTYTLPVSRPSSSGYVLSSTIGGVMSWVAQAGSPAGSNTQVQYNSSSAFAGSAAFTYGGGGDLYLGKASTTDGYLTFYRNTSSFSTTISATGATATVTYNLPQSNPTVNYQALICQTNGAMSWTSGVTFGSAYIALGVSNSSNGAVQFANSANTNTTTIQVGTGSSNTTYTLPTAAPTSNGYVLASTTGGVMSWAAQTAAAGSTYQVQYNDGSGAFAASAGFKFLAGTYTLTLGVSTTATGYLSFLNNGTGSHSITFGAPANVAADCGYTWPLAVPASNGYVLSCTVGGAMSWVAQAGGSPGGSNTYVQYNNSSAFGGVDTFTFNGTGTVTIGKVSATTGVLTMCNSGTANTMSLQANSTITASFTYTFPDKPTSVGAGFLASGTSGVLSWNNTIANLYVGVASTYQGTLGFQNSSNNYVTTLQASTSTAASRTYTLPTDFPTAVTGTSNFALVTSGTGTMSWIEAASVYLSPTQKSGNYDIVAGDHNGVMLRATAALTFGLPDDTQATIANGTTITFSAEVVGNGLVGFAAKTGGSAVIYSTVGATPKLRTQYSTASAIKVAANTWLVAGDIA